VNLRDSLCDTSGRSWGLKVNVRGFVLYLHIVIIRSCTIAVVNSLIADLISRSGFHVF
jgi:hypothetical protein